MQITHEALKMLGTRVAGKNAFELAGSLPWPANAKRLLSP
jgi:hypothetical protein